MNSTRRRAEWQIALWSIFLACFVGAGVLPLKSVQRQRQVSNQGRYSSVDAILRDELELENGSAALAAAVADVPPETPISVVYCSTGMEALSGMITTQILWQRNVKEVRSSSPHGTDLDLKRLTARDGVAIFVALNPPPELGKATAIGPYVHVVKIGAHP